ncbi:beta-propeller fold lactonase family protein, partial [Staphylococcus epidermidis]|uniref:beta-propeller fold lactonase family protein n=1 Tax=Staphylococcus epidermidis TaxID=1282 RepID=UPI0011A5E742
HEFPTPSHQTQHSSHLHFLNETPHHNYLLPTDLPTHTLLTYKFPHHRLKQYPLSQFKNSHRPPHIPFTNHPPHPYILHHLSNHLTLTQYQHPNFI